MQTAERDLSSARRSASAHFNHILRICRLVRPAAFRPRPLSAVGSALDQLSSPSVPTPVSTQSIRLPSLPSPCVPVRPPSASIDGVHGMVQKCQRVPWGLPARDRKPRRQWLSRRWPVAGRRLLGFLVSTACAAALAGRACDQTGLSSLHCRPPSTVARCRVTSGTDRRRASLRRRELKIMSWMAVCGWCGPLDSRGAVPSRAKPSLCLSCDPACLRIVPRTIRSRRKMGIAARMHAWPWLQTGRLQRPRHWLPGHHVQNRRDSEDNFRLLRPSTVPPDIWHTSSAPDFAPPQLTYCTSIFFARRRLGGPEPNVQDSRLTANHQPV
jgi:hypothetical protein